MKRLIGTEETSLVQGPARPSSRFSTALTGTYCEVLIPRDEGTRNSLIPLRITHYSRGRLYGMPLVTEPDGKTRTT